MILILKKGEKTRLTRNFMSNEFDCKCTRDDCKDTKVDTQLLVLLEQVRTCLGVPIKLTSAYRCSAHNAAVGGAGGSEHVNGSAADIQPTQGSFSDTDAGKVRHLMKGYGGLGQYPVPGGRLAWLHIDTGPERAWSVNT